MANERAKLKDVFHKLAFTRLGAHRLGLGFDNLVMGQMDCQKEFSGIALIYFCSTKEEFF